MKRLLALVFLITPAVFAQSAEYGRSSAGTFDMTSKQVMPFSGSLSLTASRGLGLGGTFGGTVVKDRVWFFASAERAPQLFATRTIPTAVVDAKTIAQIGDRQTISAIFAPSRFSTVPSSFLSLHSTSILSSNSFVTVDVSQSRH